jgi:hypothetical protein
MPQNARNKVKINTPWVVADDASGNHNYLPNSGLVEDMLLPTTGYDILQGPAPNSQEEGKWSSNAF